MRIRLLVCAAMFGAMTPAVALADDPNDPAMANRAARALDHAMTRDHNLREAAMVRERDARYADGWRAWRGQGTSRVADAAFTARTRDHDAAMAQYARDHANYERNMASWRQAVAACRAGDDAACGN